MWLERLHEPAAALHWNPGRSASVATPIGWHGSVCEDCGAIECAVYAVGSWTDSCTNAIPRLLEHLSAPRKEPIGPWAHAYPHFARPGPQVGFLQEMLRWWDHWPEGLDTGVMD